MLCFAKCHLRVNGGMRALHTRFTRIGALRYAVGYRDSFINRSPLEGESSSCAGPDELDASLDINPLNTYQDPDSTPAEDIFIKCEEIATSGVIPPFCPTLLSIPPITTIIPITVAITDRTLSVNKVIQPKTPSRDGDAVNGEENNNELAGNDGGENGSGLGQEAVD